MLAAFWSHEHVQSSDLTSVGSKMSAVKDVVLAAAARVVLAGHRKRRPRRFWVRPLSKTRDKFIRSDLLSDSNEDQRDPLSGKLRCEHKTSFENAKLWCEDIVNKYIAHNIYKQNYWKTSALGKIFAENICWAYRKSTGNIAFVSNMLCYRKKLQIS